MTVKTLYLVRHAKSSWANLSGGDHARPLNERGRANAPAMAERLRLRGVKLDRLITSSAQRTKETGRFLAKGLRVESPQVEEEDELYGADVADWIRLIQKLNESWQTVMMIGHNPTLTELAHEFGRTDILNVPTCGVLECQFEGEFWGNFGDQLRELKVRFDFPKNTGEPF